MDIEPGQTSARIVIQQDNGFCIGSSKTELPAGTGFKSN